MTEWAQDFFEISDAVNNNSELEERILDLVETEPIHGKAIEGGGRTDALREILTQFFNGEIELREAYAAVSTELPRRESPHSGNNQVFSRGWEERLIRTQGSRFYNQAVLQLLLEGGEEECRVPHSDHEDPDTKCTLILAGGTEETEVLLERLERTYSRADYHDEVKIPNHPHCTHTITPIEDSM